MKYLHTMVRVSDLDQSLDFYCNKLGLKEVRRMESQQGRFTLVYLAAPGDEDAQVELTYNWDPEVYGEARNFGHLAYEVDDLEAWRERLRNEGIAAEDGVKIPGYVRVEFRDPFGNRVELIQRTPDPPTG